jgi:hypothetical protein
MSNCSVPAGLKATDPVTAFSSGLGGLKRYSRSLATNESGCEWGSERDGDRIGDRPKPGLDAFELSEPRREGMASGTEGDRPVASRERTSSRAVIRVAVGRMKEGEGNCGSVGGLVDVTTLRDAREALRLELKSLSRRSNPVAIVVRKEEEWRRRGRQFRWKSASDAAWKDGAVCPCSSCFDREG